MNSTLETFVTIRLIQKADLNIQPALVSNTL